MENSKKRNSISYSFINGYYFCPYKWKLENFVYKDKNFFNHNFFMGTIYHLFLEEYLKLNENNLVFKDDIFENAYKEILNKSKILIDEIKNSDEYYILKENDFLNKELLEKYNNFAQEKNIKEIEKFLNNKSKNNLKLFINNFLNIIKTHYSKYKINNIVVEKKIWLNLSDIFKNEKYNVKLNGYIDVLIECEKNIIIIDLKTISGETSKNFYISNNNENKFNQLLLYKFILLNNKEELEINNNKNIQCVYLFYNKKNNKMELFKLNSNNNKLIINLNKLKNIIDNYLLIENQNIVLNENKTYIKNLKNCLLCPFNEIDEICDKRNFKYIL